MQHILNIAFDFDDEKAKKTAERAVESELDKIIRDIVTEKIAPTEVSFYSKETGKRDWSSFYYRVDNIFRDFLEENKYDIINVAAAKLVKSVQSSKAWKEKVEEAVSKESQ